MMSTYVASDELLKICPYDCNHRIAPKKFSTHVAECAKKSTKKLKTCPFDSCHRIEPEIFEAHLIQCESSNPSVLEKYRREQAEWDSIPDELNHSSSEVINLAQRIKSLSVNPASRPNEWDCDWDIKPKKYIIPGLEGPDLNVTNGKVNHNLNIQMMKPAQKKKYQAKLVQETFERKKEKEMAPILAAAAEKEEQERVKREKVKKEEQERIETMKLEKEKIQKKKEAAAKARKDKKKAAKRAAFMAKQSEEERINGNEEIGPSEDDAGE